MDDKDNNDLGDAASQIVTAVTVDVTAQEERSERPRRRHVSLRLRFEILHRDRHKCRYCGRGAGDVELQVDHVIPVAKGGLTEPGNLAAACFDCNNGKSDRILRPLEEEAPKPAPVTTKPLQTWRGFELVPVSDAMFYWSVNDNGVITSFVSGPRYAPGRPADPGLRHYRNAWGCCVSGWGYTNACASMASWLMTGFATPDALYEFYFALATIREFGWARTMVEEADCHPEIQHKLARYKNRED